MVSLNNASSGCCLSKANALRNSWLFVKHLGIVFHTERRTNLIAAQIPLPQEIDRSFTGIG